MRLPTSTSVYQAVEFEIGVHPADDFVFDPVLGPEEPPDRIGLNAALGERLKAALAALRQNGGTPLGDPEPPPIAVQTQSFVSGVFSPDKFSSLTLLISAIRDAQGRTSGGTPQERDFNRRLFLVPNAHVARLEVGAVFRDGALRPGDSGHGGRALRRRRPQGPAGEARLHRRAGARLHRVRRGSRSSPSRRRRTAPATS